MKKQSTDNNIHNQQVLNNPMVNGAELSPTKTNNTKRFGTIDLWLIQQSYRTIAGRR